MSDYERGFGQGERDAYLDRLHGDRSRPPRVIRGEWEQGYWDGYCPRSADWALKAPVSRCQRILETA